MTSSGCIFIVFMSLLQISALSCHYSCSTCAGSTYSDCSSCPGKDRITIVPPHLEGLCQGQTPLSFNPLGFVVLVLVIGACVSSKSEEAIHLSLGLQSLGLLGLVEVNCGQAITYVLDALEYLFVLVKIGQAYKPEDNVLSGDKLYKGQALLHTADYSRNAAIVGFVVLLVFALVFLLPLYQCIRRKLTADKYHCLPDWFLEKVSFVLYVVYLFTIQEMMLVIFIGYAYSATNFVLIASSIVYFLTLLYICVSSCYKQLPFFRSRAAQLNAILKKIILPVFVLAGPSFHYIIFCVLLSFECVDIVLTCKRKVATQINRLLGYKLLESLTILLLMLYYIVQLNVNMENASFPLGVVCTITLAFNIYMLALEIILLLKDHICKDKNVEFQVANEKKKALNTTQSGLTESEDPNRKQMIQETQQGINEPTHYEITDANLVPVNIFLPEETVERTDREEHTKVQYRIPDIVFPISDIDKEDDQNKINQHEINKSVPRRQRKSPQEKNRSNKRRKQKNSLDIASDNE